jgi:hypothetical protein
MSVTTYEGVVEDGRIKLSEDVLIPESTRVMSLFLTQGINLGLIDYPALGWPHQLMLQTLSCRLQRRLMPRYDASSYEPPAPVALVTLRNPHNHHEVTI